MHATTGIVLMLLCLALSIPGYAQSPADENEELKIAALEALVAAPPERALPLARKVLLGNNSDDLKERALFVISQIDSREAQDLLVETANKSSGDLQQEAIRMIGIGGDKSALAALGPLYAKGDTELREAVLEAYLIVGDADAVYALAANAESEDEFESAVDTLGAMGANEQLRQLRDRAGASESWLDAIAVSGDVETLRDLALDNSNPERRVRAIEALGIVGGDVVSQALVDIYRGADSADVREAALDGLLIADDDQALLELYRSSSSATEKTEILEYLVMMGSDEVWAVIDAALDGGN